MRLTLHILDGLLDGWKKPFRLLGLSVSFGEQKEETPGPLLLERILAKQTECTEMLENLIREVAESRSVTEGAVALITGLREEIVGLKKKVDELNPAAFQAEIDRLVAELDAQQANLSGALVTGTVADPAQPPADNGVEAAPNVETPPPPAEEIVAAAEQVAEKVAEETPPPVNN